MLTNLRSSLMDSSEAALREVASLKAGRSITHTILGRVNMQKVFEIHPLNPLFWSQRFLDFDSLGETFGTKIMG